MSVGAVVRLNDGAHVLYGVSWRILIRQEAFCRGVKHILGQLVQIRIFQRVCKGRPESDWAEFDFLNRWRRSNKGDKGHYGAQSDFKPLY